MPWFLKLKRIVLKPQKKSLLGLRKEHEENPCQRLSRGSLFKRIKNTTSRWCELEKIAAMLYEFRVSPKSKNNCSLGNSLKHHKASITAKILAPKQVASISY